MSKAINPNSVSVWRVQNALTRDALQNACAALCHVVTMSGNVAKENCHNINVLTNVATLVSRQIDATKRVLRGMLGAAENTLVMDGNEGAAAQICAQRVLDVAEDFVKSIREQVYHRLAYTDAVDRLERVHLPRRGH